jgi:hypothetical protein
MHQRLDLPLDRADQVRMRMAQNVDGDAAGEIEIARPVFRNQVAVFAAHRTHAAPGIDGHQRGDRHGTTPVFSEKMGSDETIFWKNAHKRQMAAQRTAICTRMWWVHDPGRLSPPVYHAAGISPGAAPG